MEDKIPLLAVVGPTASGKTALGVHLAKYFDGEIVSADSMQIYKGMDIATAKPSIDERGGIPHHLMDIIEPTESFSVSDYVTMANKVIDEIHSRGKMPILVGGTGLYVNSLIDNIIFCEEDGDLQYRSRLKKIADEQGSQVLLDRLKEIDPDYASKLHPNNKNRIIRGLEIFHTTKVTMSEHLKKSREIPSRFKTCLLGLDFHDRSKLYDRINKRVDIMVEQGLLSEAEKVVNSKELRTSYQAIGYKELSRYFNGEEDLKQALEHIKQQTRRYAKRQLTWFRRDERINWIYVDEYDSIQTFFEQSVKTVENKAFL